MNITIADHEETSDEKEVGGDEKQWKQLVITLQNN